MSKPLSAFRKAWLNWKTLRLPWRKRFLVGIDLQGNTFWEFRDLRGAESPDSTVTRWRRIVEMPRGTQMSDVKVSPMWHQWLRHVRQHPPSLQEQQQDVVRQAQMKQLAAAADARWAGATRVDGPIAAKPLQGTPGTQGRALPSSTRHEPKAPGQEWQPEAWSGISKK